MSKKNFTVLVSVLSLVLIVIIAKAILKKDIKDNAALNTTDLMSKYQGMQKSKKISIMIFSYDADCCENTKRFFDEYNSKGKKLLKDYEKKINTLFINTALLEEKGKDALIKIAKENKAQNLPFILIMDKKGETFKVIEGVFEDEEVRKIIDGMVK